MIVVDTNIIGYLYLSTDYSAQVSRLLSAAPDWVAPPLWHSELRNVLIMYIRHNRLTLPDTQLIMKKAESLMAGKTYPVDSAFVLSLAASSSCAAYDCEFVALAQDLSVPLLTFDKKTLREFPDTAVAPEAFLAR